MRFTTRSETVGAHTHVRVWANGALAGTLVLRPDEAETFERRMTDGAIVEGLGEICQAATERAPQRLPEGHFCENGCSPLKVKAGLCDTWNPDGTERESEYVHEEPADEDDYAAEVSHA